MEDKEYIRCQKDFKKFKRSPFCKVMLEQLDGLLFRFYLQGFADSLEGGKN